MSKANYIPFPGLRWRGLTLQLFAWVLFPLIAFLLIVTFGSLAFHQRAMRTMVGERDERAARTAARALTEAMNYRADAIQTLSLRAADGRPPRHVLFSSTFLAPDFDAGMAFFSPEGELLAFIGDEAFWTEPTDAQQVELQKMLANVTTEPSFSSVIPSLNGSKPIVLVSAAANPNAPILVGAFPPLILALGLISAMGAGLVNVVVAIAITSWAPFARITRAKVLSIKEREFVEAGIAIGETDANILLRYVLPTIIAPNLVLATLTIPAAILMTSALSFLGFGAQPPSPDWGAILNEGREFLRDAWWISTFPGVAILITTLAFNFLGDGLRDVFDPKQTVQ